MAKPEQWIAANVTDRYISVGDMPRLPTFEPRSSVNLLVYYDKRNVDQSSDLKELVRVGWIKMDKKSTFSTVRIVEKQTKVIEKQTIVKNEVRKSDKSYQPLSLEHWDMNPPKNITDALDRLAEKVHNYCFRVSEMADHRLRCRLPHIEYGDSVNVAAMSQYVGYQVAAHNLPDVWLETQGEGIVIAVLDTGCDVGHVDLKNSFAEVTGYSADVTDGNGHGTHCVGIISANNNTAGIVGVAPMAMILPIKVLNDDGWGYEDDIAHGIHIAIDMGADIISMSLGADMDLPLVHEAIKRAYDANIPVVCAAGNSGDTGTDINFPARYHESISVGALDKDRLRAEFSQTGSSLDFMAPGVSILSTVPDNRYQYMSGTSMATPWVAGVIALMMSKHRRLGGQTPLDSIDAIKEHLSRTAIDMGDVGKDNLTGYGLIDVPEVVKSIEAIEKHPDVIIAAIQGDAPGHEFENVYHEWIQFLNVSGTALNMTGWYVEDAAGWHYDFPENYIFLKGSLMRLRTGKGEDTVSDLHWGYGRPILNNEGDTVYLYNKDARLVTQYTYVVE